MPALAVILGVIYFISLPALASFSIADAEKVTKSLFDKTDSEYQVIIDKYTNQNRELNNLESIELATAYGLNGELEVSQSIFTKLLSSASNNESELFIYAQFQLASIHKELNDLNAGKPIFEALIESNNAKYKILSHLNLAEWLSVRAKNTEALKHAEKAYTLMHHSNDNELLIRAVTVKSQIHYQLGQFEQTVKDLEQVAKLMKEQGLIRDQGVMINNRVAVLTEMGDYKQARAALDELRAFPKEQKTERFMYFLNFRAAKIEYFDGDINKALDYINFAAPLIDKIQSPIFNMDYALNALAINAKAGNREKAEQLMNQVLALSEQHGMKGPDIWLYLARAQGSLGNFDQAILNFEKWGTVLKERHQKALSDKAARFNNDTKLALQEAEKQHLARENIRKEELLETQKSKQQLQLILLAIFVIALVFSGRLIVRLNRLSNTDMLTKCHNRRKGMNLAQHYNTRSETSFIMLDIDYFKQINDNFGHAQGDFVLKQVTNVCNDQLRSKDFISRLGGEEFLIGLVNCPPEQAKSIAERIRVAIESQVIKDKSLPEPVTVSMGLVPASAKESVDRVLAFADEALYRAKENGRNQVIEYAA